MRPAKKMLVLDDLFAVLFVARVRLQLLDLHDCVALRTVFEPRRLAVAATSAFSWVCGGHGFLIPSDWCSGLGRTVLEPGPHYACSGTCPPVPNCVITCELPDPCFVSTCSCPVTSSCPIGYVSPDRALNRHDFVMPRALPFQDAAVGEEWQVDNPRVTGMGAKLVRRRPWRRRPGRTFRSSATRCCRTPLLAPIAYGGIPPNLVLDNPPAGLGPVAAPARWTARRRPVTTRWPVASPPVLPDSPILPSTRVRLATVAARYS